MTQEELMEKVIAVVVEKLGVKEDQCKTEAKFVEDLGADSLDQVELVMALEDEFDLEIPDEDAQKLSSVGTVIEYVQSKV
ncbi:MAG: acyl carrier protein [Fibrobacterales bacterium]